MKRLFVVALLALLALPGCYAQKALDEGRKVGQDGVSFFQRLTSTAVDFVFALPKAVLGGDSAPAIDKGYSLGEMLAALAVTACTGAPLTYGVGRLHGRRKAERLNGNGQAGGVPAGNPV